MESIPLVFEPQSRFYTSPVVVLDFQVGGTTPPPPKKKEAYHSTYHINNIDYDSRKTNAGVIVFQNAPLIAEKESKLGPARRTPLREMSAISDGAVDAKTKQNKRIICTVCMGVIPPLELRGYRSKSCTGSMH